MKNILSLLLVLTNFTFITIVGQDDKTPQQAQDYIQQVSSSVTTVADVLFNPIMLADDKVQPNPYPLASINEKAVDATFGSNGLKINAITLQHIKNFYFYLEYIVKLELGARIATYALQRNIDIYSLLEQSDGWKKLVEQATSSAGNWNQLLATIKTIEQPQFDLIRGTMNVATWQEVTASSFWQSIPITSDLIMQSSFWQKYLTYEIAQLFDQDARLATAMFNVEKRIFPYIPSIEVAYYNTDFAYLRVASEYFRLSLIVNDKIRDRAIRQNIELAKNIDPATNQIDLVKTYSVILAFKQDPWYQVLSIAHQNIETIVQQAKDLSATATIISTQNPMIQTELTCIAMLKNIQGQLNDLYMKDQLENTIKIVSSPTISKPMPSLFVYDTQDYIYLEDLALIHDQFKTADVTELNPSSKTITLGGQEKDEIIIQDFSAWLSDQWDEIKDEGTQVWNDVKQTGKDIGKSTTDVWQGIKDEAEAIGYGGAALGTLMAGNPQDAKNLLLKAEALQSKVASDIKQITGDTKTLLDDTVSVAKDATSIGAQLSGITLAGITGNTTLGDLLDESIKASVGTLIDLYAGMNAVLLEEVGAALYLTADAIALATDVTTKSIMDVMRGQWSQLGQDLLNGLESMVADVAVTLWSSVTFVGKYFISTLRNAVALIGYLTAMITEAIVSSTTDLLKGFASMVNSLGWQGAAEALNDASQEMQAHKQTISATVTTALLVASVFLTDGVSLGASPLLLAFTVGPQPFQIIGSWQQDEQMEALVAEQTQFLDTYQTFVNNSQKISTTIMKASNDELVVKNSSQIINEERALGFYQNFLSQYFESTKQQMSFYVGSFLAPQLQQDEQYKLRFADVGSLYGFKTGDGDVTGVLNLNPSQGFPLYNKGRNLFSQEIAVYPAIATQDDQEVKQKFWFNQKETIPLTTDTTDVEIRWQALYVLSSFYIGLYVGGQPIDVASIRNTNSAPIDAGNLAKMLVYKKENTESSITLGLYEHEGKGWFTEPINGPSFEVGTWYRMKMQLNDTNLKIKVWQETQAEPTTWQSFTVAKTLQKTIGFISSGASTQYQIITPSIPVTPTTLRGDIRQTEQERSNIAQQILQQKVTPPFGALSLQAVGKPQILKGQFIYTTQATQLKNQQNQLIDDYVVLGTPGIGATIINQGISPRDQYGLLSNPTIVSLISGKAFNSNTQKITTCANVLDLFLQAHGPLTNTLETKLKKLRDDYVAARIGPFKFGEISLLSTGTPDLIQSHYIYQALSPEPELRTTDTMVYDYFLVLGTDNKLGADYDETIQFIQSLVTGYRYDRTGTKKEARYLTGSDALDVYSSTLGQLRPELKNAILNATTFYKTKVKEEEKERQSLDMIAVQQTSSKDIAPTTGPQKDVIITSTPSQAITPAENSLQERAEDAGSAGWGF